MGKEKGREKDRRRCYHQVKTAVKGKNKKIRRRERRKPVSARLLLIAGLSQKEKRIPHEMSHSKPALLVVDVSSFMTKWKHFLFLGTATRWRKALGRPAFFSFLSSLMDRLRAAGHNRLTEEEKIPLISIGREVKCLSLSPIFIWIQIQYIFKSLPSSSSSSLSARALLCAWFLSLSFQQEPGRWDR